MEGLQREFPETECTVKYRADILNGSLNTWITMEIKIGRQYHGCPKNVYWSLSQFWISMDSDYCTLTKLMNTLTQINNQCGVDQHCECWSAAFVSVGRSQGWARVLISIDQHWSALISIEQLWSVLISIDHRSALIRVNKIDQQCWEWISVGLRQGSAGEAKLPKLSRVSFACKQASDIIWKIYFHKDRKASMKNFSPWERC